MNEREREGKRDGERERGERAVAPDEESAKGKTPPPLPPRSPRAWELFRKIRKQPPPRYQQGRATAGCQSAGRPRGRPGEKQKHMSTLWPLGRATCQEAGPNWVGQWRLTRHLQNAGHKFNFRFIPLLLPAFLLVTAWAGQSTR